MCLCVCSKINNVLLEERKNKMWYFLPHTLLMRFFPHWKMCGCFVDSNYRLTGAVLALMIGSAFSNADVKSVFHLFPLCPSLFPWSSRIIPPTFSHSSQEADAISSRFFLTPGWPTIPTSTLSLTFWTGTRSARPQSTVMVQDHSPPYSIQIHIKLWATCTLALSSGNLPLVRSTLS